MTSLSTVLDLPLHLKNGKASFKNFSTNFPKKNNKMKRKEKRIESKESYCSTVFI